MRRGDETKYGHGRETESRRRGVRGSDVCTLRTMRTRNNTTQKKQLCCPPRHNARSPAYCLIARESAS
ncbi:hypothetical protein EVAR_16199_1 [Eumeta japonica]|uniref:Uncharacterized protein n=1 Tax=Eumeta variegata TaxID=151549 RepID=A0A4C1U5J3_EUMVA|nr:hypothetical protein EVAR_16199_1 [Eumeta japonica]